MIYNYFLYIMITCTVYPIFFQIDETMINILSDEALSKYGDAIRISLNAFVASLNSDKNEGTSSVGNNKQLTLTVKYDSPQEGKLDMLSLSWTKHLVQFWTKSTLTALTFSLLIGYM